MRGHSGAVGLPKPGRMKGYGVTDTFSGPITRQDGSEGVAEGASMSNEEILAMDWSVQGVSGSATG